MDLQNIINENDKEINSENEKLKKILGKCLKYGGLIIAAGTLCVSLLAIFFKVMWYYYQLGCFSAYKIDKSYIDVSENSVIYIFRILGMALLLAFSNWVFYMLCRKKNVVKIQTVINGIVLLCIEGLILIGIVFLITDTNIFIAVYQVYKRRYWWKCLEYIGYIFIMLFVFNMFGLYMGVINSILEKKQHLKKRKSIIKEIINVVGIVCTLAVSLPFAFYTYGLNIMRDNVEFKIIIENQVSDEENYIRNVLNGNNQYIFQSTVTKDKYNVFAVVYEDSNEYVVATIKNSGKIDFDLQKTISKSNVQIYYIDDYMKIKEKFQFE